jgi:translocation and assembly module TamB
MVRLAGTAQYHAQANKPALDAIVLEGNLNSDALLIVTPSVRTQIRAISGRYNLRDGNLDLRNLSAGALGGTVHGDLHITDVAGSGQAELRASVENIGLRAAQAIANPESIRDIKVTGTATGDVDARWAKTLDTLSARADASIHGTISPTEQTNGALPLTGAVHLEYSAITRRLTFSQSTIRMPQTTLTLNGTVSKGSALQVQFDSKDLHEMETAAAVFSPEISHQHLDLHGAASFNGTVRGRTDNPEIQGQFSATDLHVKNTVWTSAKGTVDLTPSRIVISNGELVPANQGHLTFNFAANLNHWAFSKTNPIELTLNATQLDVAQLESLTGSQFPLTGTLAANVSVHGSVENPVGQGTLTISQATLSNEPIQIINASFQGDGNAVHANLSFRMPAGAAQGTVTYFPKQEAYNTNFTINGLHLDQLQNLRARNIQVQGVLNAQVAGTGTIQNPSLQINAEVPQLTVQNQTINQLKFQADVANRIATVNLDSQAMNTFVKGHGTVNLTGDYDVDATFDTSQIALQPIIAAYSTIQGTNISGEAELHASVKGPLKDRSRIQAQITVPTLALTYKKDVQFAAANPVKLDYANGVLTIQRTEIRGTDTDLQLQGSIPVNSNAPARLFLVGTVDLKIAELIDPDTTSSGQLRFNIDSYGQTTNPNVQGQIQLVNANIAGSDLPMGLENANGQLNLTTSRLQIQRLTGSLGGGNLTVTGGVSYRPNLQYDLAIAGRGIRFHIPDGVRQAVDADLAITGNKDAGLVQGQVRLNQISFARDFDFSTIANLFSSTNTQVPSPFLQTIRLNLGVQSTSDLNLVSSTLSVQGAANLRVQGTAADPVLLGRVNVTGGDIMFRGARYEIQPSTVAFVDPYRIQPQLNASVDTTVKEYKIHMQFRGTLDRLRTTYTSEPPLPEADVINLLVFGKTSEEQAANPTPGNVAAESAIASAVSSQVTGRIQHVAGISSISIDPALQTGNQTNGGTRVTVQQRVTGTVFVTFSADVSGTQREVVKLEYQYSPRLSVVGVRDENGGFSLDFRIHNTW